MSLIFSHQLLAGAKVGLGHNSKKLSSMYAALSFGVLLPAVKCLGGVWAASKTNLKQVAAHLSHL